MADNLTAQTTVATIPSGSVVATDDVAGVHYQKVKLFEATADSSTATGVAASPLRVDPTGATTQPVSAASLPLPTGAATAALQLPNSHDVTIDNAAGASAVNVQDGGNSLTIDAASLPLPTGASTAALQTQPGVDIGDVTVNNAAGASAVNVQDGGNSLTIDATSLPLPTGAATAALQLPDGHNVTVDNAAGAAAVNIQDGGNTITVDGTVAVSTLPASTNTIEVVGDAAHDAAAAGNPVLIAATHETAADSAPTNRLATVTDGDVTRLSATDGALYVIPGGPQQWKARLTGLIAADTTVKASPGAGLSLYVQTVVFSIGAATASSILLEESTTTPVFGPHYLEAIAGRGVAVTFSPPIKITAATLLSASGTGSTTATLDVYGFTAPG